MAVSNSMIGFFCVAGHMRLRTTRGVLKVSTSMSSVDTMYTCPASHIAAHCASASDGACAHTERYKSIAELMYPGSSPA